MFDNCFFMIYCHASELYFGRTLRYGWILECEIHEVFGHVQFSAFFFKLLSQLYIILYTWSSDSRIYHF